MHITVNSDSDSDFDDTLNARRRMLAELSYDANVSVDTANVDKIGNMLDDLVLASAQAEQRLAAHRADREQIAQMRDQVSRDSLKMCSKVDDAQQSREQRRQRRLQEIQLAQQRAEEIARQQQELAAEKERQKLETSRLKKRLERMREEEARQREQEKLAEEAARLAAEENRVIEEQKAREAARLASEQARKEEARKEEARKEEARKEETRKEEARKEEARKEEARKAQAEAAAANPGFTDQSQVAREFAHYKDLIAKYKQELVGPVSAQPALKTLCFGYKTKIKTKLGQLTYTKAKVTQTRTEINGLFSEARTHGELVLGWVMNCYAKAMVSHAEGQAHLAVQTAVPLAMVTILLWTDFKELGEFVIARLVKKCPQIIGYGCSIDTEEGRLRMGYKREDSRWESQESYSERIAAMTALFAAMTQTKLGQKLGIKHPYPIQHSWVFLARQINKQRDLLLNADYAAVAAWWDICCERFQLAYGKQGTKALTLATSEWTSQSAEKRYPAAARLHLLGEDWKTTGKLQQAWKPLG